MESVHDEHVSMYDTKMNHEKVNCSQTHDTITKTLQVHITLWHILNHYSSSNTNIFPLSSYSYVRSQRVFSDHEHSWTGITALINKLVSTLVVSSDPSNRTSLFLCSPITRHLWVTWRPMCQTSSPYPIGKGFPGITVWRSYSSEPSDLIDNSDCFTVRMI
jgi:hypothetical protein